MTKETKFISRCLFFFVLLFLSSRSFAEHDDLPPKIKKLIHELEMDKSHLQGGAYGILHKGKVVYKSTFGHRKGKNGPITTNTLFPLASVSKPVTAAAIALLVEGGQCNFQERLKLAHLQDTLSLGDILSHTTGYRFSGNHEIEHGMSHEKLMEHLQKSKARCSPGKCYSYSNATFSMVEEALNTKKLSLHHAFQNLRKSLKTEEIQLLPISEGLEVAYPHLKNRRGHLVPLLFPPYYPRTVPAAAGVFASIDGMLEIMKLSFGYRPDLISNKTLAVMHTPVISNRDIRRWSLAWLHDTRSIESEYGLGWRILRTKHNPKKEIIFHSGMISGINSFIGFIPSEEIGIVILLNQKSHLPVKRALEFWKA